MRDFDLWAGTRMIVLKGVRERVDCVRFAPDGPGLLAVAKRTGVQVWAGAAGGGRPVVRPLDGADRAAFAAGGRVFAEGHDPGLVHFPPGGGPAVKLAPDPPATGVWRAAVSPCGRRVAAVEYADGPAAHRITCRDAADPANALWRTPTTHHVHAVVFLTPDELLSVESDAPHSSRLVVRRAADGALVRDGEQPAESAWVNWSAGTPDGRAAAGLWEGKLFVLDTADLAADPRGVRNSTKKDFTGVAFHPSGSYLAATSNDATVTLFDTATWAVVRAFDWAVGRLRSVAFSPDGTLCAAGSDTGKVVVWDFDA